MISDGLAGEAVWVPGEPVLSGGRGGFEWVDQIRDALTGPVRDPYLTFVVSGIRRRGHPFDLDNLVHPVLLALDEPIDRVSARLHVGDGPGLLIEDRPPSPPPAGCIHSLYVAEHSMTSARGRLGIPDIADDPVCDQHEGLGLSLEFDREDIPIRQGWFGPTEAVIDDLVPWLGTYQVNKLIADHRIRDLRISRGVDPTRTGVRIALWYIPDDQVPVPMDLLTFVGSLGGSKPAPGP